MAATYANAERDFHPQTKQIMRFDFSFLPNDLQTADGDKDYAFKRLQVGTWNDDGVRRTAWMVPQETKLPVPKGLRPIFVKDLGRVRNRTLLLPTEVTYVDAFAVDKRFIGSGELNIKAVGISADDIRTKWFDFMVNAYFYLLPLELRKVASIERDTLDVRLFRAVAAPPQPSNSKKDRAVGAFHQRYPDLNTDLKIVNAFMDSTHDFKFDRVDLDRIELAQRRTAKR